MCFFFQQQGNNTNILERYSSFTRKEQRPALFKIKASKKVPDVCGSDEMQRNKKRQCLGKLYTGKIMIWAGFLVNCSMFFSLLL